MTKTKDYRTLSMELDAVLAQLQEPNVSVDQAVKLYEQGSQLIVKLEEHLRQAENKIKQLKLVADKSA